MDGGEEGGRAEFGEKRDRRRYRKILVDGDDEARPSFSQSSTFECIDKISPKRPRFI